MYFLNKILIFYTGKKDMSLIFSVISRGFASSPMASAAIKNVTIVGGGLMGSGIAQVNL